MLKFVTSLSANMKAWLNVVHLMSIDNAWNKRASLTARLSEDHFVSEWTAADR